MYLFYILPPSAQHCRYNGDMYVLLTLWWKWQVDIPKTPHAEEFEKSPQDAEVKLR